MGETPRHFVPMVGLHDNLGAELDGMGGVLRCHRCKREQPMKGAGGYLRGGWPECCGETMEWLTARQLATETMYGCTCPFPRTICPGCGLDCEACAAAARNT
jgi:hypothetical protein